jgi:hypothetical protein
VTRLQVDDQGLNASRGSDFSSSPPCPDRHGAHSISSQTGTSDSFHEGKASRHEANQSPTSSDKVKMCRAIPPLPYMYSCHDV